RTICWRPRNSQNHRAAESVGEDEVRPALDFDHSCCGTPSGACPRNHHYPPLAPTTPDYTASSITTRACSLAFTHPRGTRSTEDEIRRSLGWFDARPCWTE